MKSRVLVLGAGFGGMELATLLSEALGAAADVTVIEKSDTFIFGYSKIDVMFGRETLEEVRLPYRNFVKSGVRFVEETIASIDPTARRVRTTRGTSIWPRRQAWPRTATSSTRWQAQTKRARLCPRFPKARQS